MAHRDHDLVRDVRAALGAGADERLERPARAPGWGRSCGLAAAESGAWGRFSTTPAAGPPAGCYSPQGLSQRAPRTLTPSAPERKVAPPSRDVGQAVADAHAAAGGAAEAGARVAGAARTQGCGKVNPEAGMPGGLGGESAGSTPLGVLKMQRCTRDGVDALLVAPDGSWAPTPAQPLARARERAAIGSIGPGMSRQSRAPTAPVVLADVEHWVGRGIAGAGQLHPLECRCAIDDGQPCVGQQRRKDAARHLAAGASEGGGRCTPIRCFDARVPRATRPHSVLFVTRQVGCKGGDGGRQQTDASGRANHLVTAVTGVV